MPDPALPPLWPRLQSLTDRDPRRAVRFAQHALEQAPAGDPAQQAWARLALGWTLLAWERFDAARAELRSAHDAFATLGDATAVLRCRATLAILAVAQLADPASETTLDRLAAEFDMIELPSEALRCRLYQVALLNSLGRAPEAAQMLTQLLPRIAAQPSLEQARWWRVRAATAIGQGESAGALIFLTQAEAMFTAERQPLELAKTWFQQAWALLNQEQLAAALTAYQRAERIFVRCDLPQRMAWCAKNIGLLQMRQGSYAAALAATLRALAIFQAVGNQAEIAGCQLNLGNLYYYTGLWDAALASYERAEAGLRAAGVVADAWLARRNRAMTYRALGQYAAAAALLDEVAAQAQRAENRVELAAIWQEQAVVLEQLGQPEQADARYGQARAALLDLHNLPGAASCAVEHGWLALRSGSVDAARSHFVFAAPLVLAHPYDHWRNDHGLARCAETAGEYTAALQHYQTALAIVATLREQLVHEGASSGLYQQALDLHADATRLAVRQGAGRLVVELAEQQRALVLKHVLQTGAGALPDAYQAEQARLRDQIVQQLAGPSGPVEVNDQLDVALTAYGELLLQARHSALEPDTDLDAAPFDLDQLRTHLSARYGGQWTVLLYLAGGDDLVIAMLTPDALELATTPDDTALQHFLQRATQPGYRRHTYRDLPFHQGQTQQRWAVLTRLADRLIPTQARQRLHADHRLLIIPSGPLHGVPWPALRLDNAWLVERAILQLAPSLTTWMLLAERRPPANTALLLGCSTFGDRAMPLPGVAGELAAIAAAWPGPSEQLQNERLTRAALLERAARGDLARYGVLHIAAHARMLPSRGFAAHLRLFDDDLLLPEVAMLRLNGALVVLSVCDGAAAETLPGEEVLSLSWALLAAGARGVIASLWRIDDAAAASCMESYYAECRTSADAAVALARMQRVMIARPSQDAIGPDAWGSFMLTGAGRLA